MQKTSIVQEINEILQRIDKKISETQDIISKPKAKPPNAHLIASTSSLNDLLKRSSKSKVSSSTQATSSSAHSQNFPFRPLLCKKSLNIMKKQKNSRKNLSKSPSKVDTFDYEFKPCTLERSSKILKNAKKVRNLVWDDLYRLSYEKNKNKSIEEESKEMYESRFQDFSFKPNVRVDGRTYERNTQWQKDRNEKIMALAERKHLKEFKECTFAPQVFIRKTQDDEVELKEISGVIQFVNRIKSCAVVEEKGEKERKTQRFRDLSQVEYNKAKEQLEEYLHSFKIN